MREKYDTEKRYNIYNKSVWTKIQTLSTVANGLLKRPLKSLCVLSEYNVMFVTHVGCMPLFFTCLPCWIHACFSFMCCANTYGTFCSCVWYIHMTLGKKESFDGAKRTKNRCQPFKKLLWQGFLHVRYEKYNLALKANQLHLGIFARSVYIGIPENTKSCYIIVFNIVM